MKKNRKKGFTLSEVLIALTLIGVVSALAVPSLVTNAEISKKKVKFKKGYSTISSAYSQVLSEKEPENFKALADDLVKYMNIKYYYNTSKNLQSTHGVGTSTSKGTGSNWMMTEDGIAYRIVQNQATGKCTTEKTTINTSTQTDISSIPSCYYIIIDIDGPKKGDNVAASATINASTGKIESIKGDRFYAFISKTGVTTGNPTSAHDNLSGARIMEAED